MSLPKRPDDLRHNGERLKIMRQKREQWLLDHREEVERIDPKQLAQTMKRNGLYSQTTYLIDIMTSIDKHCNRLKILNKGNRRIVFS